MTTIDVAVPCYQYGRYLQDCVASITSQGIADLRVLIIDNGSTDDSLELAQELARVDRRITVVRHPRNLGQKHAYNEAIDWAASDYFAILDADDVLAEGALTRTVAVMDKTPSLAFCHGPEYAVPFAAGSAPPLPATAAQHHWKIETGLEFIRRICLRPINPVGTTGFVTRTVIQKRVGHYNPDLEHADDVEMWLRLARFGGVARTPVVQGIRRVHPHQLTRYFDAAFVRDCEQRLSAYKCFFSGDGKSVPNAQALYRSAERSLASKAYWSSSIAHGPRVSAGERFTHEICALPPSEHGAPAAAGLVGTERECGGTPCSVLPHRCKCGAAGAGVNLL